jgi:hypothetical protein
MAERRRLLDSQPSIAGGFSSSIVANGVSVQFTVVLVQPLGDPLHLVDLGTLRLDNVRA